MGIWKAVLLASLMGSLISAPLLGRVGTDFERVAIPGTVVLGGAFMLGSILFGRHREPSCQDGEKLQTCCVTKVLTNSSQVWQLVCPSNANCSAEGTVSSLKCIGSDFPKNAGSKPVFDVWVWPLFSVGGGLLILSLLSASYIACLPPLYDVYFES